MFICLLWFALRYADRDERPDEDRRTFISTFPGEVVGTGSSSSSIASKSPVWRIPTPRIFSGMVIFEFEKRIWRVRRLCSLLLGRMSWPCYIIGIDVAGVRVDSARTMD